MINLNQKEIFILKDLQAQEKLCIKKYAGYEKDARDPELRSLFNKIKEQEQQHYNTLKDILDGNTPSVSSKSTNNSYTPQASYTNNANMEDKDHDAFLCTDAIAMEKYVSSAYNFDLFQFGNTEIRKVLNDIQTEEQVHAEMIYKYKTANLMA